MKEILSRRSFLLRGLELPLAGGAVLALTACGEKPGEGADLVCADPKTLTTAEESVRRSLNYVESAPDRDSSCASCDFFSAASVTGGCGSCAIFGGGPVNPQGRCDSWSADA